MKFYHSLKFKLSIIMFLLLFVPVTIIGLTSYLKTDILERVVIDKAVLEESSPAFTKIFKEYEQILEDISKKEEMQYQSYQFTNSAEKNITNMPLANEPVKTEFYEKFLSTFQSSQEYTLNLYMGTENGALYLHSIPPAEVDLNEYDPTEREWYKQAEEANGEIIWTAPYIDTASGFSTITLAKAVKDANGKIIGVAGIDFNMHKLAVTLRNNLLMKDLIIGFISLVVGLLLTYFFVRGVNKPLSLLQEGLSRLSQGDLSAEKINLKTKDEFSLIIDSYNQMTENLKELIQQVMTTSEHVAASSQELSANADETSRASEQIAVSIQEVASGTDSQLTQVNNTITLVGHISSEVTSISKHVGEVTQSTNNTTNHSINGVQVVQSAIHQMEIIDERTNETSNVIKLLNNKASEIEKILALINGIAEQTNLLALNAAIEAARAGEHGKGFAVVADEVRKLAEQSSASTKQINEIISDIIQNTSLAVHSMQDGENAVKKGKELVNEAGSSFKEISTAIELVSDQLLQVSDSVNEINNQTTSLVDQMEHINEVTIKSNSYTTEVAAATEEQTATMEEVSASSKVLADMSHKLLEIARQFKF
ncbi:methyl-accepting chemotaxis protein [Bacillus sp. BGMRC 2118]|nr:methyl-accepting chemotaxis protein [Bacillus sp. BGMRC 2118]